MSAPAETASRKPRDEEIDAYGLTHQGRVRTDNQDHFLIASLHRRVNVQAASIPHPERLSEPAARLATLAMVADGVGGGARGEEASRIAVEQVTAYVAESMHCYYRNDPGDDEAFSNALIDAAMRAHEKLRETAAGYDGRNMATTLTLWLGLWPRSYLLQVGDSRCYVLRDGGLMQISRDQTMAQDLVDQGLMSRTDAMRSRWSNTLSSALGGAEHAPVVTRIDQDWGNVGLLCSDGLTRHVSDEQIRDRLLNMTSARQVCEQLLDDALEAGGTDNVTIVVGRTVEGRG